MNTPDNNPYTDSNPSQAIQPDTDKGSVLSGFFIGWGLMIGCVMLAGFFIAILNEVSNSISNYDNFIFQTLALVTIVLPIIIVVSAMIWLGKKGKSKTVKGIAASVISLIALALLLVAACFGIFAMNGSGFH
jgi:cytochrome bd-type quinol oxidase subunit 2